MVLERFKHAAVIVFDCSMSMTGYFEEAKDLLSRYLRKEFYFQPKQSLGLILMGTTETKNHMASSGHYQHVVEQGEILEGNLALLKFVDTELKCDAATADLTDAIIIGFDALHAKTQGKKFKKKMIVFTNAASPVVGWKDIPLVKKGMIEAGTSITFVLFGHEGGPTIVDDGVWENADHGHQEHNVRCIRKMVSGIGDSRVLNSTEMNDAVNAPRKKTVMQTVKWKGVLEITPQCKLAVHVFGKVMEDRFPSMSKFSLVSKQSANPGSLDVVMERTYLSDFEEGVSVVPEMQIKGYHYGKSRVPIDAGFEKSQYVAQKCMQVLGFTPRAKIPRHHFMGGIDLVCSDSSDPRSATALAALSQALEETKRGAIARFVKRDAPILIALLPHIENGVPCLIAAQLPFAEDLRFFSFPSLDRDGVRPNAVQLQATEALIKAMDLDTYPNQKYIPETTFNPVLHHLHISMQGRLFNEKKDIPPSPFQDILGPDPQVVAGSRPAVRQYTAAFTFTPVVDKKAVKKKTWAEVKIGDDDEDVADGSSEKRSRSDGASVSMVSITASKVSSVGEMNPVSDFKNMISRRDVDFVSTAISEMQKVIFSIVDASIGDSSFGKAIGCVSALREACAKGAADESEQYNDFLKTLRLKYQTMPFWSFIKAKPELGLIKNSATTEDEISSFFSTTVGSIVTAPPPASADDDNMFDEAD